MRSSRLSQQSAWAYLQTSLYLWSKTSFIKCRSNDTDISGHVHTCNYATVGNFNSFCVSLCRMLPRHIMSMLGNCLAVLAVLLTGCSGQEIEGELDFLLMLWSCGFCGIITYPELCIWLYGLWHAVCVRMCVCQLLFGNQTLNRNKNTSKPHISVFNVKFCLYVLSVVAGSAGQSSGEYHPLQAHVTAVPHAVLFIEYE